MRDTRARLFTVLAFAGLLSQAAGAPLSAQGDANGPQALARHKGLTTGEWLAIMSQEELLTPVPEDGNFPAILDGGLHRNDVVFVGGPVMELGQPRVTIPVTIPSGTSLFIPIITVWCSEAEEEPFHGADEAEMRACANALIDIVEDVLVEVDGRPVTENLRTESPLFRYGPLPEDNLPGLEPGTQSDAVSAGYAVMLPPLSVGVHRIVTRGSVPAFGIGVDAELVVTVEPKGKTNGSLQR